MHPEVFRRPLALPHSPDASGKLQPGHFSSGGGLSSSPPGLRGAAAARGQRLQGYLPGSHGVLGPLHLGGLGRLGPGKKRKLRRWKRARVGLFLLLEGVSKFCCGPWFSVCFSFPMKFPPPPPRGKPHLSLHFQPLPAKNGMRGLDTSQEDKDAFVLAMCASCGLKSLPGPTLPHGFH